jgi:hypothetical protein
MVGDRCCRLIYLPKEAAVLLRGGIFLFTAVLGF